MSSAARRPAARRRLPLYFTPGHPLPSRVGRGRWRFSECQGVLAWTRHRRPIEGRRCPRAGVVALRGGAHARPFQGNAFPRERARTARGPGAPPIAGFPLGTLRPRSGLEGPIEALSPASTLLPSHAEVLAFDATNIPAIAGEKAGIIKEGRPVVVSPQPDGGLSVIRERCRQLNCALYAHGEAFSAAWSDQGLSYRGINLTLDALHPGIAGSYQLANAASALAAAELLGGMGFSLDAHSLRGGVETAFWPGRMEMLGTAPRVLLDGAHNPAGSKALAEALEDIPRVRLLVVAGLMGDKDLEGILGPLLPLIDELFAVAPPLDRALPSRQLAQFCLLRGVKSQDAGSVADGLSSACRAATADDIVLVCGSLFTVGEARAFLLSKKYEPFRG